MLVTKNLVKTADKLFEFVDFNSLGSDKRDVAIAFLLKAAISVTHYDTMRGKSSG
jgi:hypothetical protein